MTPKQKLAAMQKLQNSDGWQVIMEIIDQETMSVARNLGDDPRLPDSHIHFQRGLIRAATEFKSIPARLITRLENEIALEEAMKMPRQGRAKED